MRDLHAMFHPRSVAIVGASPDPRKVRGMAVAALIGSGFAGAIYPINPSHSEVQGHRAYPNVAAVPEPIDLAVVMVAAEQVVPALEECAACGVRSAVVLAGLPSGAAGERIMAGMTAVARTSGMVVLGPNALGFWNPGHSVVGTFAPLVEDAATAALSPPRTVSVVSHSGGIGNSLYDKCFRASIGVRYVVTTGNEADLEMLEVIDWLVEEGGSRAILVYLEGFRRPEDFAAVAARAANRGVRIIVAKAGRSDAGARAAVSHTAHMTGANTAYDAMFERYGVLRVDDLEQMIAVAKILSGGRPMAGSNVMILSTGGGFGALLADACEARGVGVPDLAPDFRARITTVIPEYGNAGNPVDLPGGYVLEDNGASLARILDGFADAPGLDAVILCFGIDAPGRIERMRAALEPSLRRLGKPALFLSPTLVAPDNQRLLADWGVQCYTVRECADALSALVGLTRFEERWRAAGAAAPGGPASLPDPAGWTFDETAETFARFGLSFPPQAIVQSQEAAIDFANQVGWPVALKIHSADLPHKTDVGGVALAIADADGLRGAYDAIARSVAAKRPDAAIGGMLVQKMAGKGREYAIGVLRDADFGPMLMLSAGGILIEVLEDAVFAPLPLSAGDAARMVDRLKSAVLLKPLRGSPAGDRAALERLLLSISDLVMALGDGFAEIEFNPVIVHAAGEGVSVVDHLIVPAMR